MGTHFALTRLIVDPGGILLRCFETASPPGHIALLLNVVSLLSAAITCWRAKLINWQVGLPVLVVAVILSPLGALLTQRVNKSVLLLLNWLGLDPKVAAGTTTHAQFAGEPHGHHSSEADARGHGFEPAAQGRHARMAEAIADCDVLLARGMGARGI